MSEYTYADVIIDPDDPRAEIGKEYYFGNNPTCLLKDISQLSAQEGKLILKDLAIEAQSSPFMSSGNKWFVCLIRKKEPEKRYVPFDLSKEKDRAKLRGAWVKAKKDPDKHQNVCGVCSQYVFLSCQAEGYDAEDFLESFTFIDGSPCGRLVEGE